jgi:hypothetical protein
LWNSSAFGASGCGRVGASFLAVSTFPPQLHQLLARHRGPQRGELATFLGGGVLFDELLEPVY